jgi:hypothetical protein
MLTSKNLDSIFITFHLPNSVWVCTCLFLSIVDDFLRNEIIYVNHAQGQLQYLVITSINQSII